MQSSRLLHAIAFVPCVAQSPMTRSPSSFSQLFASTGFVGPLLLVVGLVALVIALRRWLELRRFAPPTLVRELESRVHGGQLDAGLEHAVDSRTVLGELVAAGLYLRRAGLDEMLANVERAAAKGLLSTGNRVANLARIGGLVLLVGVFGTTLGLMNALLVIGQLKEPQVHDFVRGIGESLTCTAVALFVALPCFVAFFWLDSQLTRRTHAAREIAEELMREAAEKSRNG